MKQAVLFKRFTYSEHKEGYSQHCTADIDAREPEWLFNRDGKNSSGNCREHKVRSTQRVVRRAKHQRTSPSILLNLIVNSLMSSVLLAVLSELLHQLVESLLSVTQP